jgi:hypothetical protein
MFESSSSAYSPEEDESELEESKFEGSDVMMLVDEA